MGGRLEPSLPLGLEEEHGVLPDVRVQVAEEQILAREHGAEFLVPQQRGGRYALLGLIAFAQGAEAQHLAVRSEHRAAAPAPQGRERIQPLLQVGRGGGRHHQLRRQYHACGARHAIISVGDDGHQLGR
jgi:hypothetical protein